MSHFAKLNANNIVTEVIVAEKDFINSGLVGDEFLWVQTSYNGNFRKQFANVGDTYDTTKNKFIKAKPFASWTLDASDDWQPPTVKPNDSKSYIWDEDTTAWVEVV